MHRVRPAPAYRSLLTWRWLFAVILAAAVVALCVLAGRWQYGKHVVRSAEVDQVASSYDATVVPLDDLLGPSAPLDPRLAWRPVLARGQYLDEHTVLVRNRVVEGRPGFEVVTPLLLDDGTALLVDRGWVPPGPSGTEPEAVPPAVSGEVRIVVRLRPGERPVDRTSLPGQVWRVDPAGIGARAALDVRGGYGLLADAEDVPGAPTALPRPQPDQGPHLAYAVQWWLFAGAVVVLTVLQARRELFEPPPGGRGSGEQSPGRVRPDSDEDVEDRALDDAEARG